MAGCVGCTCQRSPGVGTGGWVFLASRVSHTVAALESVLARTEASVTRRAPGLLAAATTDPSGLLAAARAALTATEAEEVRAAVLGDLDHDDLLAAAFTAPTLAQCGARVDHARLLPLLDDELNAFHSVYQPIVSLRPEAGHAVVGHEALLRATGPDGPVLPDQMFAAASAAGWLHALDRVGRTTALRGAAGWLGDDLLFVNFVPTTIYRPEVCLRTTEQAARTAGLRLDQLVFEVTESERVTDIDHLSFVFDYYRRRGCRVALDDLGSGFSSLNLLVRLRPDVVKLDKELVQGLPDPVNTAVVAAIVQMTHSYGGSVLAECIETAEQAASATDLGVDLGQGWFFGRPQPRTRAATGTRPVLTPAG